MNDPRNIASDLAVEALSSALEGLRIDVIVSGSIGAVESVRLIRALRRLGAFVQPVMTQGAEQFITPLALSWAAGGTETKTRFLAGAEHIAQGDLCVIAPASANFISKLSRGYCDNHALALANSYLGQKKPLFLLANMHDSLRESPIIAENLERLCSLPGVQALGARKEEGKQKFSDPRLLADEIAHRFHKARIAASGKAARGMVLIMGSTKTYVDDVRYLSNYSSGTLGSKIAECAYRAGFDVHAVCGSSSFKPEHATSLTSVETNAEMESAGQDLLNAYPYGLVMPASILDFLIDVRRKGKIASSKEEKLSLTLTKTHKLIERLQPQHPCKVAFKLESPLDLDLRLSTFAKRISEQKLSLLFLNDLGSAQIAATHEAYPLKPEMSNSERKIRDLEPLRGKRAIAECILQHFEEAYSTDLRAAQKPSAIKGQR